MKSMRRLLVLGVAAVLLGVPGLAYAQQIIYTVCRSYSAQKNCYKCSDYFSVRSEEQAQRKCKGGTPHYFPSVPALQKWMISNCTCDNDEDQ